MRWQVWLFSLLTFILLASPKRAEFYIFQTPPIIEFQIPMPAVLIDRSEAQFWAWMCAMDTAESNGDWTIINEIGCMGKYQFAYPTLKRLGYGHVTPARFGKNPNIFPPAVQDDAMRQLTALNAQHARRYTAYVGKTVGGVKVTWSGLLAAYHLGGARSVKRFMESNGRINPYDLNCKHVSDYLRQFAGYDFEI